jgi:hypothetical protein
MNFEELYNFVLQENVVVEEGAKDTLKMLALAAFFGLMTKGITYPILKHRLDTKLKQVEQQQVITAQNYANAQVNRIVQSEPEVVDQINMSKDVDKAIELFQKSLEIKQQPQTETLESDNFESFLADAMKYIEPKENSDGKIRNEVYADSKGYPTIGIGHLVIPDDARNGVFKPNELQLDRNGNIKRVKISDARAREIFKLDLTKKYNSIKREFPSFDKYPHNLKIAMMDGYFRGDLSGSPQTKNQIKQAMSLYLKDRKNEAVKYLEAAANEYVDNKEYKLSKKMKQGVYSRMNNNAALIRTALDPNFDKTLLTRNVYDL